MQGKFVNILTKFFFDTKIKIYFKILDFYERKFSTNLHITRQST